MSPKIYFAGKISKDGWRQELVDVLYSGDIEEQKPIATDLAGRPYLYTGPFFRDYHKLTFDADRHGAALGGNAHEPPDEDEQAQVVKICLAQIRKADAVYARLSEESYGSIAELGYASALGKKIFIARGAISDQWFVTRLPGVVRVDNDLKKGVVEMLDVLTPPKPAGFELCESPVEKNIYTSFAKHCAFSLSSRGRPRGVGADFKIYPQWTQGRFRFDFAVLGRDKKIAVEIDGHAFHERTQEQAFRDKSRDRILQAEGWLVFRFTGSEAHRDPDRCVKEVLSALRR